MQFITDDSFQIKKRISIPRDTEIIFVNDFFVEDIIGGAELTSEALIKSTEIKIAKLHSRDVTQELLQNFQHMYWIFSNIAQINHELLPTIAANLKYSVINFDYKFCKYRLIELHQQSEQRECDCHDQMIGKLVSTFMYSADSLWFMSEMQANIWFERFPFLFEKDWTVLSSVFDEDFFAHYTNVKNDLLTGKIKKNNKYVILNSGSWIKGTEDAVRYCREHKIDYEVVGGLNYVDFLNKLATSKGLIYLPRGGDTCPRLVIEAKLFGCELVLNKHVQHRTEEWFDTTDLNVITSYLYLSRDRFWSGIKAIINYQPTLSGYTTVRDCNVQDYPWKQCITSMLNFCDEVVVLDGGSTDGTWEELQAWAREEPKIVAKQFARNWNDKRFAVYDGQQKAIARTLCSSEFCWQQDSDEVVHENDYEKVKNLLRNWPKAVNLLALPVIEYWGGSNKIRCDIHPWKWRLSMNDTHITHGIPLEQRRFDKEGDVYSLGSDGCDYVRSDTFQTVPCGMFYTNEIDQLRLAALTDELAREKYTQWFNAAITQLPAVHHYSWFNIERKIKTYQKYWEAHWENLFNKKIEDTAENNKFFGRPWSEVSSSDIKGLAKKLGNEMGGWIFHTAVDFSKPTPHVNLQVTHPEVMKQWVEANENECLEKS